MSRLPYTDPAADAVFEKYNVDSRTPMGVPAAVQARRTLVDGYATPTDDSKERKE